MWSLPDINRLNAAAVTNREALEEAVLTGMLRGEQVTCNDADENCRGVLRYELWFDVFSDLPKGIVGHCVYHRELSGVPLGYFRCDVCRHLFVERYTHEQYSINTNKGLMCLPCAAAYYIGNSSNWIELTEAKIEALDFERVRLAAHVLAVGMQVPATIQLFGCVELDFATGGEVRSSTYADPTPDAGVQHLRDILTDAKDAGHSRALLIMDAGYQFSVSIGCYVDSPKRRQIVQ